MKLISTDQLEHNKYYLVYEYFGGPNQNPPYKGITIWQYITDFKMADVHTKTGNSPYSIHCAKSASTEIWRLWDIHNNVAHCWFTDKLQTLTYFELTQNELLIHAVMEVI